MDFLVSGVILNVYVEEDFFDLKTGAVINKGRARVQILTSKKLNNGFSVQTLATFGTKAPEIYRDHLNKNVQLSCSAGVYQTDNDKVGQYFTLNDAENRTLIQQQKNKPTSAPAA